MARWRLTAKHYLRSPGIEWEYREQDRETGREVRKRFEVPLFLNPDNPADCDRNGDCIVCWEGKGERRDTIFLGEPTPDMEPLDEEAEKVTESLKHKWVNAGQFELGQQDYSMSILSKLTEQIDRIAREPSASPISVPPSVSKEDFERLQSQVATLMAQNAELKERTL